MVRLVLGVLAAGILALCVGLSGGTRARLEPVAIAVPSTEGTAIAALERAVASERDPALATGAAELPAALEPRASMHVATRVQGTLFDLATGPIAEGLSACVRLVDQNGAQRSAAVQQDGAYAFSALAFGTYWVTVRAQGYRALQSKLELSPERPSLHMDFTLEKAVELRILVVGPESASALVAVATREPPGERVLSSELGCFRSSTAETGPRPAGCIGILQLECDLPAYVSLVQHEVVLETLRVVSAHDAVTFVLSAEERLAKLATLRMLVLDAATRAPLAQAQVNGSAETDAQGNATIRGCKPGACELRIRARGYETLRRSVEAPAGVTTDLGAVALEREVVLEGDVVDAAGAPRAAAFDLGICAAPGLPIDWLPGSGFESRGDGRFKVPGLGRRQYVIRSRSRDTAGERSWRGASLVTPDVLVDLRGGAAPALELRLSPAALLVVQAACTGEEAQDFRVLGEQGLEIVAGRLRGSRPRALELPCGDYRVLLLDAQGRAESERLVTLRPDGSLRSGTTSPDRSCPCSSPDR